MGAVCCGNFTEGNKKAVKGDTAREALNHICAVLEESGWGNPSKTPARKLKLILGWQVWGYTEKDPPTKHQKALSTIVYQDNLAHAITPYAKHVRFSS
eukprot:13294079-Ditylum_brightwellii.AAC.1